MRETRTIRESSGQTGAGGLAVLESQVADLREENARLKHRLEEAEMSAELEACADRILAIPMPEGP